MASHSYLGTIFDTPQRTELRIVEDALLTVSAAGEIEAVLDPKVAPEAHAAAVAAADAAGTLTRLGAGQYLLPGLVDLHVHAPQWPQLGKALDRPLEVWLQDYTFPLEARYADIDFASRSYTSLVETLLANGTTTVAYFATTHVQASVLLARICLEKGQRAVVGRVAMDLPDQCPSYYRDASPAEAVALSEQFIQEVRALPGNEAQRVLPAVIPRFIPSCSHEALEGLGALAQRYGCHVQTHCSESDWEHQHVLDRYQKHDAFALDDFRLLTRKTVLAHSNFINGEDMDLIQARGCAVAHCPLSNVYFSDAVFPLRVALDRGLRVGMGTDISGGPSASLFEVCRSAVGNARMLERGTDPLLARAQRAQRPAPDRVTPVEAFYVATALGGEGLDLPVGRLQAGYRFDAMVVDTTVPHTNVHVFAEVDKLEDVFQKIIYGVHPVNIVKTYVDGRLVHERK